MKWHDANVFYRLGFDFYCDIATQVAKTRKAMKWTSKELAEKSGISLSRLSKLENVQIRFYLDDVEKLAAALNVSVDYLIGAELDAGGDECLYLVWSDEVPDLKLYQRSTSRQLASLQLHAYVNEKFGVRFFGQRSRLCVKLVGVPVRKAEMQARFPKSVDKDDDVILPDGAEE